MAKLIYISNASLDGYCEDPQGGINFGEPDEEYFGLINEIERPVGTYLYGRRMYETMVYWETAPARDEPPWVAEFTGMWRRADKIVFSNTLSSASSARTIVEREFDAETIGQKKADSARDLTVGGVDLAAHAFKAGLVDECHLFLWPLVLGGGKPALPTNQRVDLQLLDEHRTRQGVVHLHHRVVG